MDWKGRNSGLGAVPPNPKSRPRKMRRLQDKKIASDEFMAAAIGDVEWLKQSLKDRKGEVTYDENGLAPIHLAALHGRLDCLRLLIEKHKVEVNLPSGTGWRPIHLSISNQTGKRSLQCLLYLLEHRADASVENEDGVTPVHQAASEGHVQCLKLLIDVKAKIDGKDRRGHLPIDLAKLWGHRKCARILATEKWHQDKDYISKEMRQLKKQKMQEALRELEDFDKRDDEQFYGQAAFSDWLNQHGIQMPGAKAHKPKPPRTKKKEAAQPPEKKPTKTEEKSAEKPSVPEKPPLVSGGRLEPIKESLYKPNSVSSDPSGGLPDGLLPPQERRVQIVSRKDDGTSDEDGTTMASSSPDRGFYSDYKVMKAMTPHQELLYSTEPQETMSKEASLWYNPTDWNKSTKVKETFNEYMPLLPDVYPRDIYTMLPHKHATPHELNIWKSPKVFVTNETEQTKRADAEVNIRKKLDEMQISPESQDFILNPNDIERPVLHKCKNIIDVPTKRKVPEPAKPKNESALHLSSDLRSELVQRALLIQVDKRTPSKISVRFNPNGGGEVLPPRERLLKAFENFTRPSYYPHIVGEEYDLNLGDSLI